MNKIFGKTKRIHFIGIGGIGMSGMAEFLYNYDFKITGSDINTSERTLHLTKMGIKISQEHRKENITSANLIVYSSAVPYDNPEITEGKRLKIPIIKRAELLGELIKIKETSIAVSGTHGKTTAASMISSILIEAQLDPTIIIGGIVNKFNNNNISGLGDIIVVEADEFDKSFLSLNPTFSIINNMELEHLDIYKDIEDLKTTFTQFANSIPFYGSVCICGDFKELINILPRIKRNYKTFGVNNKSVDVRAKNINFRENKTFFDILINNKKIDFQLNVPGLHNVYNALAAITLCLEIEINIEHIVNGLNSYNGVKRRFDVKYDKINNSNIMLIDDYAHHPSEVKATIDAINSGWEGRRVISIFQPHLYSRTKDFYKDFSNALMKSNINILLPIYPAREKPIKDISSLLIKEQLNLGGHPETYHCTDKNLLPELINKIKKNNDIIVFMGAGDIYKSINPTYQKLNE